MRFSVISPIVLSSVAAFQIVPLPSSTASPSLLRRQDSSSSCSAVDPKLPGNFKCASGTNCISLDSSSSGLCCPEGDSCDNIQTISCNVQSQNVTNNPTAGIFTTRLGDKLPVCGDKCCPFGYQCIADANGPAVCGLIANTSIIGKTDASGTPTTTKPAPSSTTTTALSTSTSTAASAAVAAQADKSCNKFPIGVFLAGFFPGMFVGAFLMLAWVICTGRHRKPDARSRSRHASSSSSFYKPTISDPIPLDSSGGLRTDFLRRTTGRAKSIFSTRSQAAPSPPFAPSAPSHWKMPTPPVPSNVPTAPAGLPVTPERRVVAQHDSETESIRVYSPPTHPTNPAALAPLRGMAAQRYAGNNNSMGSPFQTPPNQNTYGHPADHLPQNSTVVSPTRHDRGLSTFSAVSELSATPDEPVTLTPMRYDGGTGAGVFDPTATKRTRSASRDNVSRPTTTFTEMLHEAGFPDPMLHDQDPGTPAVPKIPKGYRRGS